MIAQRARYLGRRPYPSTRLLDIKVCMFSGLYEIFPRVEKSRRHSILLPCCRQRGRRVLSAPEAVALFAYYLYQMPDA
jgi:hypothetical protein